MTIPTYDAIILGAGAAGLMCAAIAGQRGRRVLLLDHADAAGQEDPDFGRRAVQFHQSPHRARPLSLGQPAFRQIGARPLHAADFIALVERHGIAWHEKTLGQLFCDGSAQQIVAMLLDECDAGGVTIALGAAGQRGRACRRAVSASTSASRAGGGAGAGDRHRRAVDPAKWARPASPMISRAGSA